MYKIYNEENSICVTTLAEVRDLVGASADDMRKLSLYAWKVRNINGFQIINYK
ncbi:MAG: hypothetical protein NTX28_07725 [Novosphingobium sp.]|nr:hypothetical protein [Novosphingobium sp.]